MDSEDQPFEDLCNALHDTLQEHGVHAQALQLAVVFDNEAVLEVKGTCFGGTHIAYEGQLATLDELLNKDVK